MLRPLDKVAAAAAAVVAPPATAVVSGRMLLVLTLPALVEKLVPPRIV